MSSVDLPPVEVAVAGNTQPEEPRPLECECGAINEWTWYSPTARSTGRKFPPRWSAPRLNPCKFCAPPGPRPGPLEVLEVLDDIELRLARANLPKPMRHASLEKGRVVMQGSEKEDAFRRRMARNPGLLGVLKCNAEAFGVVTSWNAEGMLLMLGPSGTGKSTLLCALARRWLNVQRKGWRQLSVQPDENRFSDQLAWDYGVSRRMFESRCRAGYMGVSYTQVGDLLRREQLKMSGLDSKPLLDYATRRGIVMLDELGAGRTPTEWQADRIEQILGHRHDYRLPTVVVTNRTLEELTGPSPIFGERVARRMKEWNRAHFGGAAWNSTGAT